METESVYNTSEVFNRISMYYMYMRGKSKSKGMIVGNF